MSIHNLDDLIRQASDAQKPEQTKAPVALPETLNGQPLVPIGECLTVVLQVKNTPDSVLAFLKECARMAAHLMACYLEQKRLEREGGAK